MFFVFFFKCGLILLVVVFVCVVCFFSGFFRKDSKPVRNSPGLFNDAIPANQWKAAVAISKPSYVWTIPRYTWVIFGFLF